MFVISHEISFLGGTAAFALHVVFSLLNTMYVPYAAVYYVDRVHLMCSINTACQHLTMSDYLTTEIIIMGVGVLLHCPVWFFVLLLLDIKKSGGNISDLFKYFIVSINSPLLYSTIYKKKEMVKVPMLFTIKKMQTS